MSTTAPAPGFTPAELVHFTNLQNLFDSLNAAARDPETPPAARELLLPRIGTVAGEIQQMNEIAYTRDTVDLQKEAVQLGPANADLKQLKLELQRYARVTATLQKVTGDLDTTLISAQGLGL